MSDPIADLLTRIRNAILRDKEIVSVPLSTIKEDIVRVLKERGYIKGYEIKERDIIISLKYKKGESVISGIERVSKPSLKVYSSYRDIPKVLNGLGFCILSTPGGVITDSEARRNKVGGEIICKVW
ncbi:MAG: 30S ribosomal protein S8 [Patescibacteria group bacterium]